jgi:hypothetical protein
VLITAEFVVLRYDGESESGHPADKYHRQHLFYYITRCFNQEQLKLFYATNHPQVRKRQLKVIDPLLVR